MGGFFSGIETARMTEGGNYLKPGIYDVELIKCKTDKTRHGVGFFACDFKIAGSNNPDHRIGDVNNWFVGFDKDAALGNIKGWAVAVLSNLTPGIDQNAITEEVMEGLIEKNGEAIKGQKLRVQVTLVPTKTGGQFSRHQWYPAGEAVSA
jgi:hypothetical protein